MQMAFSIKSVEKYTVLVSNGGWSGQLSCSGAVDIFSSNEQISVSNVTKDLR